MIKRVSTALALCAVPLAACNSEPQVRASNASVEEVAKKVADASADGAFLRPGKWQTRATIDQLNAPGMPPGLADNLKARMAERPATESCMTAADMKKPKTDFFAGAKNCRYDHFNMGHGKIDASMRCSGGGGGSGGQLMTMAGDYTPEAYRMKMTTAMERGSSAPQMTITMHVDGKRVGECDAKAG